MTELMLPDVPGQFVLSITNSAKGTYFDCPYKYYLEYIRRLTPITPADYFRWGDLVHRVREQVALGGKEALIHMDDCIQYVVEEIRTAIETKELRCSAKVVEEYEYMFDALPDVMDGWMLANAPVANLLRYESQAVEGKFAMVLYTDETLKIVFQGKIDDIVRDTKTGKTLNWEIKTAAQTGENFYNQKQFDGQPKGYLLAAQRLYGFHHTDAMYEVLKKCQRRRDKGETTEEYYHRLGKWTKANYKTAIERRVISFTQEEIDAYEYELIHAGKLMYFSYRDILWTKHHPGNRQGGCGFSGICKHGEFTTTETKRFYTRPAKEQHPEL